MPQTAAFSGFTQTGYNSENTAQFNISGNFTNGWNLYTKGWKSGNTIFFAVLGFRDSYSARPTGIGRIICYGSDGAFWTAGASSYSSERSLYISSNFIYTQNAGYRSYAYCAYSVKEL